MYKLILIYNKSDFTFLHVKVDSNINLMRLKSQFLVSF